MQNTATGRGETIITVKVTPEIRAHFWAAAKAQDRSVSSYVRGLALRDMAEKATTTTPATPGR